jgi:HEPN domain-containing protein
MPHSSRKAGDPHVWLQVAKADLAMAIAPLPPGGMYEQLCFHAQQAAEKSLKGVLLNLGIVFPFTHNLQALIDLCPADISMPAGIEEIVDLNAYAVLTRYPGELEPVDDSDYDRAIQLARTVVDWAEGILNK